MKSEWQSHRKDDELERKHHIHMIDALADAVLDRTITLDDYLSACRHESNELWVPQTAVSHG